LDGKGFARRRSKELRRPGFLLRRSTALLSRRRFCMKWILIMAVLVVGLVPAEADAGCRRLRVRKVFRILTLRRDRSQRSCGDCAATSAIPPPPSY
jgi:hypothetical protein